MKNKTRSTIEYFNETRKQKGNWKRKKNMIGEDIVICTVCGKIMKQGYSNFCAYCGADMQTYYSI